MIPTSRDIVYSLNAAKTAARMDRQPLSFTRDVRRRSVRGEDTLRFSAAPHTNPALADRVVYSVDTLARPDGTRNFDACVNKTFDTEPEFVAALRRALKAEAKGGAK